MARKWPQFCDRQVGVIVSNRSYICSVCGATRRAPAVYFIPQERSLEEVQATKAWPKHCDEPMVTMSWEQTAAASQLNQKERVGWVASGMHVLTHRGKHKWKPATSVMQIEESKRQVQLPRMK